MRKHLGWIAAPLFLVSACIGIAQERREPAATEREPAANRREAADRNATDRNATDRNATDRDAAPGRDAARRDGARPNATGQASNAGSQGSADQQIAAVKLACCRNEIELAKLAQQKSQNEEVKQFAAKMVKEHTEGCAKLEQAAGNLAAGHSAGGTSAVREGADRRDGARPGAAPGADVEVRTQPGRPGADVNVRAGGAAETRDGAHGSINWVSIHKEIAEQSLATTKKELSQKSSEEFDKCYIGLAIASHQHAIDADHVFMNKVSPQFRSDIEDGLKMATSHLNEAKDIMKKLEGKSPRLSQKPE